MPRASSGSTPNTNRQETPPPPSDGGRASQQAGACGTDNEIEDLRRRLAEAHSRLLAAEERAEKVHQADAAALSAELEARKQVGARRETWRHRLPSHFPTQF